MPIAQPRLVAGVVGLSPVDLDNARRQSPVRVAFKVETAFVVATPAWLEWEREPEYGLGIDWIDLVAPDGTLTADLQLTDGTITETVDLGFVGPATGGRKFLEFPGALLLKPNATVRFRFPDAVAGMRYSVLASIFRWRTWKQMPPVSYNNVFTIPAATGAFPAGAQIDIGFFASSIVILNKDNAVVVEYSFDGTNKAGTLNPNEPNEGVVMDGAFRKLVWLRTAPAAGAGTIVEIFAWRS